MHIYKCKNKEEHFSSGKGIGAGWVILIIIISLLLFGVSLFMYNICAGMSRYRL